MKNPKHEIRNSKQIPSPKIQMTSEVRGSVLACGGGPRLFFGWHGLPGRCGGQPARPPRQSAAKAAHSKTCRTVGTPVCNRLYGSPAGILANCLKLGAPLCWLLCFFILHSSFCLWASGQSYSIDWWTVDGGGGTSTGGVYAVSGTIGQPDAGTMSGGNFTLHGGFWSLVAAVQTPGAPCLTVFRTATNTVVVSWPLAGSAGWVLQATNALPNVAAPWPVIPPPYQTNGTNLQYIETIPTGNKFYRLYKP